MKKRFWLSFVLICISVFAAGVINVSAENGIRYEYSGLYYRESNGEVTITDCSQFATTVSIPNQINGYPVTGIGNYAFYGCSKFSSITIPEGVTSIGDSAFYDCSNLSSITIPEGVTSIGNGAFNYCSNLVSITIPGSVTSIGCDAFLGCTYLANINVSEDNRYYCSINGVLYNKDKTLIVRYAPGKTESSFSVYYSVKSIEDGAFSGCSNLSSITIPNGVTSIGDSAFYGCSNLSSITIPGGVTSIEDSAFYGCSNLSSITIPNGVTSIGDSAFYDCSKLSSITIPEGVTNIGDCAFIYCRNLSSITIPGGVRIIGDSAFRGCSNLSSITIPEGVTNIGDLAFYYCSNLWSITIPDSVTNIGKSAFESTSYYNSSSNWENDVLYIGNHLIKAKQTLSGEYTVNSNTKTIADSAFSECSNLTAINTYEDCKYYCSADGNLYDKDKKIFVQYAPGKQDNEFVVPEGVTSIKAYAFAGCNNLMNVTIPEGAMSIGAYAFSNCGQLMHITIPEGVTSIGNGAFNYCSNLVSITIPEGVTSIGDGAFSGCSKLNSITIPEGVTSIGDSAFYDCSKLSSITILEGVTSIGNYAFYNCSSLGSIALPEGVTSIGNHAFYNCSSLSSITIPNGVTSIGDSAFSYCGEVYYNGTDEEWKKIEGTGNNEYLHGVSTTYFAYMNLYDKDGKEISKKTQNMDETVDISAISIPDGSTLVLYRDRELTREYPLDTPIRENLTLYADFVELNKLKLSGTDKVGVGQKGVAYNISFSTDKNANSIVTVIKYPESLTLNEIQSEDFDISQDQYSENGYIYLSLECTYKNGNMPKNKNLSLSELLFDVSGKVKPNDSFTIEFLSDETFLADENGTTYDFSDFENVLINVNPVFIESIAINGDDEIDKATQYTAVILPENATDKELEWGVDDAEIATVSTDGVLTPIKSGTVKITATAKDGSGIYGEKTVNVKVYAEILSLESNVGVFDKTFSPSEREYTIYVPKNTASVKLTARHNGTLKMGTKSLYNGRAATVMLSDDETILKLNYKCEGYSDSIYSVKVVKFEGTKTDVSADGKTFNVKTINIDKDSVVILALYDGNKLIETQSKAYNTELTFTTDKAYVNAKVMVWKSIDGMEPVADVEIIK